MKLQKWFVLGLIFFITFANTDVKIYQLLTGTGTGPIPVQHGFYIPMILAFGLIFMKLNRPDAVGISYRGSLNIFYPVMIWFLAATLSFLFNTWYDDTVATYIAGYVSMITIYFALRDIPLTKGDFNRIMIAFSSGIFLVMLLGVIAYYRVWGIPSISTLLMARYQEELMQTYRNLTFGNVGNSASLFVMLAPSFLAMALDPSRSRLMRIWFTGCFILAGCNLVITGSRAALIVMTLAVILIFYYFKQIPKLGFILLFGTVAALFLGICFNIGLSTGGLKLFLEKLVNALTLNRQADLSILERIETIKEGWSVFNDHWLLGVGPGSAFYYISEGAAHQFFVQQGAQLGILGLFGTVVLVLVACWGLVKITLRRRVRPLDPERFIFLIGPVTFLLYGVLSNIALNIGHVNIWVAIMAAFLGLAEFREPETVGDGERLVGSNPSVDTSKLALEEAALAPESTALVLEKTPPGPGETALASEETPLKEGPDTSWQMRSG